MAEKLQEQKLQEQAEKLQEQEEKLQELEKRLHEQEERLQEQEEKLYKQELKLKNIFEEQERFLEQECKLHEEKQKTEKKVCQHKQKFEIFEKKFEEQEKRFQVQELKLHKLIQDQDMKFVDLQGKPKQNELAVKEINSINLKRTFAMENYSKEKEKDKPRDWRSPAMYTHLYPRKFCIGIDANGYGASRGKAIRVELCVMKGEYDHQLEWPAQASFTLELLNQHGGDNIIHTITKVQWQKPKATYECIYNFGRIQYGMHGAFLEHSKLTDFFDNDTLYFHLSNITVYSIDL